MRACLILGLVAAAALAQTKNKEKDPSEIGNRKVSGSVNLYSLERELALGRQLSLEVERQARLLDDPIINEYVNRIAQNLVRHSDVQFPVTVKIIESDQANAFTLPGGHIFIDTSLLKLSETEAELASTIAHELAHVAARHATRQASREQIANIATIPLGMVVGPAGMLARQVAGIGMPLGFFKFSRVFESEADMLGIQYLYETGYDPSAAIDIFERVEALERKQPGAVGRLFATHPMTPDRIAKTQKNIDQILPAKADYVINTSDYEDVRKRLVDHMQSRKINPDPARPTLLRPSEASRYEHDDARF